MDRKLVPVVEKVAASVSRTTNAAVGGPPLFDGSTTHPN
jgi:hypothetical protein